MFIPVDPKWLKTVLRCGAAAAILMALLLSACDALPDLGGGPWPTATPETVSQWAASATASSSYARPDWSPNRATGAPDVPGCSDDARAWASSRGNGVEWLQLTFSQPVYAQEVRIHQTFGRGALSRVTVYDADGNGLVLWEGTDQPDPCPGVLIVRVPAQVANPVTPTAPDGLPRTPFRVSTVRIDLDESRTGFWNQIDAVELVGVP